MIWKNFRNKQNDKKLLPKLNILSYAVFTLGLIIYFYAFFAKKVPCDTCLFGPDYEIFKGGSFSADLDPFTLNEKEAHQLMLIGPFFIMLSSLLQWIGMKRC
jgi:hypothetical protein